MGGRAGRGHDEPEAQLRALVEASLGLRCGPEAAGEADLAERGRRRPHGRALRGRGDGERDAEVGAGLVDALATLARERGCYGMWVATDAENAAALATYRAAGAGPPEPSVVLSWSW